jgi:hypothetical protein
VTGDLNAREDSDAVRLLTRDLALVDTFRQANGRARPHGLAMGARAGATVRRRVDYDAPGGGAGAAARVVASRLVLDVPRRAAAPRCGRPIITAYCPRSARPAAVSRLDERGRAPVETPASRRVWKSVRP